MRLLGAGASPPPAFSSLPPDIQAQFGPIAANLAQEGGGTADPDELYFAQSNFADVITTVQQGAPQVDPGSVVNAAVTFCSLAHTAAGAAQAVDGLLQEGLTPGSVQGIVQGFTGTSLGLAGTVAGGAIAIGGTLATAGVGAAIAVGIGVLASLIGTMFNTPPPVATVGACNLNYKPTLEIPGAFVWSRDAKAVQSGPSTANYSAWRRFPNPNAGPFDADAWWYMPGGFALGANGTQWRGNEWHACINSNETKRPIDQACYENGQNVFTQIECDSNAAAPIAQLSDGGGAIPQNIGGIPLPPTSYSAEQVAFALPGGVLRGLEVQPRVRLQWARAPGRLAGAHAGRALLECGLTNRATATKSPSPRSPPPATPSHTGPATRRRTCRCCSVICRTTDRPFSSPTARRPDVECSPVLASCTSTLDPSAAQRASEVCSAAYWEASARRAAAQAPSRSSPTRQPSSPSQPVRRFLALRLPEAGQAQSEAWQRLGREIWDQGAKSGGQLVAANPLKVIGR